jgi:tRNA-splicing ligase RtcB
MKNRKQLSGIRMGMKKLTLGDIPVYSWCDGIEEGAREQIQHLSCHPRLFHHVAVMPDCHQGYGMPIGGVIAVDGAIIPNAVGVDIGCGMCAVETDIVSNDTERIKKILSGVRSLVPLGFAHHKSAQHRERMPHIEIDGAQMPVVAREYDSALRQVGTLGGGNHFIELQRDTGGHIWIMIHSGSRNIGKQVADHYNRIAVEANERRRDPVPRGWQLAGLDEDSVEGRRYRSEMEYCVAFAHANRALMMERIVSVMGEVFGGAEFSPAINIAHNYASRERHFGKDVWVHRKGATLAGTDTTGIIPGSQGTKSYIVRGRGNPDSFMSCSHGAGRIMGRKEAERRLDLSREREKLERQGVIHSLRSKRDLDEASGAYKEIGTVMRAQNDLVKILVELSPVAVIKG